MVSVLLILQQIDIEKKMGEAPDSAYGIGVVIGSYLPFVVLAALAYGIYRYHRKKGGPQ